MNISLPALLTLVALMMVLAACGKFDDHVSILNTKIAFTSDRDGNSEIYVINADGTEQTRLTDDPRGDGSPSWSPDGRLIAFASNRDGDWEVFVMNADGTDKQQLTDDLENNTEPVWSPDGRHIAFGSDRKGNVEVFVMDADGGNAVRLGQLGHPSDWSTDD